MQVISTPFVIVSDTESVMLCFSVPLSKKIKLSLHEQNSIGKRQVKVIIVPRTGFDRVEMCVSSFVESDENIFSRLLSVLFVVISLKYIA